MDWERFYRNVYTLVKLQGLRIGEVEEKIGTSKGRLSRGKMQNPLGTKFVYGLSKILGVTVNDLFEKDLFIEYRREYLEKEIENMQKELEELRA